jgi:selenocysteine lyase/cysteine desulfurase
LKAALINAKDLPVIGAFSAASNVTGIVSDVASITCLLKAHGAISVWDYAGAGPYEVIDMGLGMDVVALPRTSLSAGPVPLVF